MAEVFDFKPNKMFVAEMVLESATTDMPGVSTEGGTHSFRKYSLRPRSVPKKQTNSSGQGAAKVRVKAAGRPKTASKSSKPKPAILSKYRRKNANARERFRMKAINDGFEALRRVIPFHPEEDPSPSPSPVNDSKKLAMTKITTLRLAIQYIRALSRLLEDHDAGLLDDSLQAAVTSGDGKTLFEDICANWNVDLTETVDKRPSDRLNDTSSDASSSGFCSDDNNRILDDFFDPFDPFSPFPSANDPGTLDALFSPTGGDFDLDDLYDPEG